MDFWKVLEYTASVTVVGLLIWLIKLVFHDKLDARWHYFIWLVLLVRLVVPADFALIRTPVSVFQGLPVSRWIEYGQLMAARKGYEDVFTTLGRVYLWGAALLGGYYLVTWAILRVSLIFAVKADESTREYVEAIAGKHGLKGCKDIRLCKSNTPYICGLFHPILVLPEDDMRPEEPVIVHELLHRKWKDVAVNMGLRIVRVVNWFNPAVWFLTGVVQNDSEALCDQRVLEYYGGNMEKEYGEMLLAMTRDKRQNPVKTGTSNMAGSYRNMRTRIRRICDFHKVPGGSGFVAFCITLMLAVAGVGASAKACGFEIHEVETDTELQGELLKAQLYHAHTPEEAVYLFLRAVMERNVFYRMSVMPRERAEGYEEFVRRCWQQENLTVRGGLIDNRLACFPYFPQATFDAKLQYRIYNLQVGEGQGTAVVFVRLSAGEGGTDHARWELALAEENGWKVWLAGDTGREAGEYQEPPLLHGSTQAGDFRLEMAAYNEAYFDRLEGWYHPSDAQAAVEGDIFPDRFSTEYKMTEYHITYVGQESLEGHFVRVEITEDGEAVPAEGMFPDGYVNGTGEAYSISWDEYFMTGFDGGELPPGETRQIGGGGNGYSEAGRGWKPGDRISCHVRIYVDDSLVGEGDIWNGDH